jgi:hypothetical protein
MAKCGKTCEVYSRCTGYFRPVKAWNKGKKEEFKDRLAYDPLKGEPGQHQPKETPDVRAA